jgi:hypothetical protein
VELWPVDEGLLVVFEVEGDLDVVGHDAAEVYFRDFYDVGDEGTACAEAEGALADED